MGATPSDYSLFRYDESFPGEPIIRMSFFDELKRRNVVRAGIAHAAIGWVLAHLAEFAIETFGAPGWASRRAAIGCVSNSCHFFDAVR
jgi:hypothetical protein